MQKAVIAQMTYEKKHYSQSGDKYIHWLAIAIAIAIITKSKSLGDGYSRPMLSVNQD